ncbi:hypothetical protein CDL15_Pgr009192 [Punica granatum]|uniref:Uncharacterized protein n=1 Tax=Punica granatum TaxID=22663 RepID=A0A218WUU9_PUNGR|nr:hypothetical protein CDL15_Pgr009192 [Punica granatum]
MARLAMVVGRSGVEEARKAVKPSKEPGSGQSWFGLLGAETVCWRLRMLKLSSEMDLEGRKHVG